jgi:hypothetical protein
VSGNHWHLDRLSARVHERNLGSGASYQLIVRGINPSDEDGADFVWSTDLGSTPATTGSANPGTAPGLVQLHGSLSRAMCVRCASRRQDPPDPLRGSVGNAARVDLESELPPRPHAGGSASTAVHTSPAKKRS